MNYLTTLAISVFLCLFSFQVNAGLLNNFEEDVKNSSEKKKQEELEQNKKEHLHHHNVDPYCPECVAEAADIAADIFFHILLGLPDTVDEINDSLKNTDFLQQPGGLDRKSLPPFFRAGVNIQHVNSNVDGFDIKLESGKGMLGAGFRFTSYSEKNTNDNSSLDFLNIHALYHMTFTDRLAVNVGAGYGEMQGGGKYGGILLTAPVLYYTGKRLGLEITPTVFDADGTTIKDFDASILYARKREAYRIGYRTLQSPNVEIDGIYIGAEVIF